MNVGLPLGAPGGGFYFVFMAGVPMFRKYDAHGRLLFERHIEGPELDAACRRCRPPGSAATTGTASACR